MVLYVYPKGYNPLNIFPKKEDEMEQTTQNAVSEETLLDLDTVEDLNFDEIQDAPGFVTPPNGLYLLTLDKACIEAYKTKAKDGQPSENRKRFAHYYSIAQVLELEDPNEQSPSVGDKFSERFMMNEQGLKYWKTKAKSIVGDIGKQTVANVLKELSSGMYTFKAKIQLKKTKGKDNKDYTNVQVRVLAKEQDVEKGAVATNDISAV